jgi:hypothetical protein
MLSITGHYFRRTVSGLIFRGAVSVLIFAAVWPAFAVETTSIPDLSGVWGRWFNLEAPSSGPGPIVSKLRRPDGTIIHSLVGDFTNPILRPHAAELVKKTGELELNGIVIPNPHMSLPRADDTTVGLPRSVPDKFCDLAEKDL